MGQLEVSVVTFNQRVFINKGEEMNIMSVLELMGLLNYMKLCEEFSTVEVHR